MTAKFFRSRVLCNRQYRLRDARESLTVPTERPSERAMRESGYPFTERRKITLSSAEGPSGGWRRGSVLPTGTCSDNQGDR